MKKRNLSYRHHYIPKFLINGFTNQEGLVFIYDKIQDRILDNPRPPKSIFWEKNRNTLNSEGEDDSTLEDVIYSKVDSESSSIVKYFQETPLGQIEFNADGTSKFLMFLIHLFWRIPKTDFAFSDLMERSTSNIPHEEYDKLKRDKNYQKIERVKLFAHHIEEMIKNHSSGGSWVNILQSKNHKYVLGDYPLLFRRTPNQFVDFIELDFMIAITSKRMYLSSEKDFTNTKLENNLRYNAAVIEQSTRYIVCGDRPTLEQSVLYYNELKKEGLHYFIRNNAFDTLKI